MRRRIKIMPDGGGLEDVTAEPQRYRPRDLVPLPVLYDDPIWRAYLVARDAFRALEHAVIGHFYGEPYDDVEQSASREYRSVQDDRSLSLDEKRRKLDEISARVLAHARELHGNGDAPR